MQRILLAAVAMLMGAAMSAPDALAASGNTWGEKYFPNVPVVTQDGKTLHFYDDLIKDKIVVVSFVYTTCADLCPVTAARLATLQERLGDAMGRDIFFISITVDPKHDTPEMLKAFGEAFDAGPGWQFVTGKPEDINQITARFGDRSSERGLQDHRNEILLGNDALGDWERDSALDDADQLLLTIRGMDPKWSDQVRQTTYSAAGDTGFVFDSGHTGEAMFQKICASCHTVGGGDRVGPDLRGVEERRDRTWLESFIINPLRARMQNDPIALELAARFPAVRMPRLGLTKTDADDMLAYIEHVTARANATAQSTPAPDHHQHQHD